MDAGLTHKQLLFGVVAILDARKEVCGRNVDVCVCVCVRARVCVLVYVYSYKGLFQPTITGLQTDMSLLELLVLVQDRHVNYLVNSTLLFFSLINAHLPPSLHSLSRPPSVLSPCPSALQMSWPSSPPPLFTVDRTRQSADSCSCRSVSDLAQDTRWAPPAGGNALVCV